MNVVNLISVFILNYHVQMIVNVQHMKCNVTNEGHFFLILRFNVSFVKKITDARLLWYNIVIESFTLNVD